jgi:hypothetical protein
MNATFPVYRADGRSTTSSPNARHPVRRRDHRARRAASQGHINRAILFVRPVRRDASDGLHGHEVQLKDHLEHGVCWDLKRLGGARWGTNYAPDRSAIFLQVVTDCLVLPEPSSKFRRCEASLVLPGGRRGWQVHDFLASRAGKGVMVGCHYLR